MGFFSPFSVAPAPNAEFRKRGSSNVPHLGQHDGDNNGCDDDDDDDGCDKNNSRWHSSEFMRATLE